MDVKVKVSASSLWRAAACPGSASLPWINSISGKAADTGTAIHKFLEDCLNLGYDAALKAVPAKYIDICKSIDVSLLPAGAGGEWHAEVSYAYNWRTGTARVLGQSMERDYSGADEDEIPGTVDIVRVTKDSVMVLDYKTGRGHVEAAENNWQLKVLGLGAARAYGKDEANVGIIWIYQDDESYLADNENYKMDEATYDDFQLEMSVASIRHVMEEAHASAELIRAGNMPKLSMGPQCTYCPASMSCPAKYGLLRRAITEPESIFVLPEILTIEEEGTLYTMVEVLEASAKAVKKTIKERAKIRPLPLPDGKFLAEVDSSEETLDPGAVKAVVTEAYGEEAAEQCVKTTTKATKSALEISVKAHKPEGATVAGEMRTLLKKISDLDGIATRSYFKVTRVDKKKLKQIEDECNGTLTEGENYDV